MDLNLLAGPAALAIAASVAAAALWRRHTRDDDLKDTVILGLTASVKEFPVSMKDLTAVVVDAAQRERDRQKNGRQTDR